MIEDRYAELRRRLEAGEPIDPTCAIAPAGGTALRTASAQRVEHAKRVTPDAVADRNSKPENLR